MEARSIQASFRTETCLIQMLIRVQPYISLNYLRDHIEEQLGPEVVPEDYVFLRSVGRCMAVVSTKRVHVSFIDMYYCA